MRKNEKWKKSHNVCPFTIPYSCFEVCWKRLWHTLSLSWCLHVCLPALYHSLCLSQWSSVYFNAGVPSLLSYGGNDEVCYISLVFHLSSITLSLFNSLSFSLSLSLTLTLFLSLFLSPSLSVSQVAEGASILGGFGFEGYGIGDPLFVWWNSLIHWRGCFSDLTIYWLTDWLTYWLNERDSYYVDIHFSITVGHILILMSNVCLNESSSTIG